jgi:hypothetical protein
MAEGNWITIAFKVISYILTFFAGGLTFTFIKNVKIRKNISKTYQKGNVAGGDIAGRDIRK